MRPTTPTLSKRTRLTAGEWRELRMQAGLDQVHLGPMLGVRNDHLSRIEHGHVPAGAVLEKLFRVTCAVQVGASVEDLRALVLLRCPVPEMRRTHG